MTRYNTLNVKLPNSQLNKLKFAIKNGTEVTLNLSSNLIKNSDDETNFLHKLLLTNTQVSKICKGYANGSSVNIKFSKTQLYKIVQSQGFLDRLLGLLQKSGLPLIGHVLKPLAKNVLIPLGLTASASATDAAIHNKMFGSGNTTLIISNEEMNDVMKIIKSLEESGILIKSISETIKNEAKEQKEGFLGMLFGMFLLGSALTGRGVIRTGEVTI